MKKKNLIPAAGSPAAALPAARSFVEDALGRLKRFLHG